MEKLWQWLDDNEHHLHCTPNPVTICVRQLNAHATLNYFEDLKMQNGKKIMSC